MTTITEDYVSFEIAKLLKEKGFDIPYYHCNRVYSDKGTLQGIYCVRFKGVEYIAAPTLQMAMKWLREVHHIHIKINLTSFDGRHPVYEALYDDVTRIRTDLFIDYGNSYEEAVEIAIKYCLENLI